MYKKSFRKCRHCEREVVSSRHKTHESKCLEQQAERMRQKHPGHPLGMPAWNKGLTFELDERILARNRHFFYGKRFGAAISGHTDETRQKIGEKLSVNNKGGRCKWYEVNGQLVQGTWERDLALKFDEMGIVWRKIKTNSYTIQYTMDGRQRHYTPDFYLEDYKLFLEVKGYWRGHDQEKMRCVIAQHPELKICIVEKDQYQKILQGELVW